MPNYSKNEVILVQYPFSDLSATKVRPAIVINAPHPFWKVIITPNHFYTLTYQSPTKQISIKQSPATFENCRACFIFNLVAGGGFEPPTFGL